VPAHSARFVLGVMFSKEIFNTAAVVAVTGEPLTRYLPVVPTVPVMVVEATKVPIDTANNVAAPMTCRTQLKHYMGIFSVLNCLNILVPPIWSMEG